VRFGVGVDRFAILGVSKGWACSCWLRECGDGLGPVVLVRKGNLVAL
jgi:hypothetical protein